MELSESELSRYIYWLKDVKKQTGKYEIPIDAMVTIIEDIPKLKLFYEWKECEKFVHYFNEVNR